MNKTLFAPPSDWHHNAILHHNYKDENNVWNAYVTGYRIAAESLSEKVLNERKNRDTVVFPIIFLYRQYLELRLKEIIAHGSDLLDVDYKKTTHHDLMILWLQVKRIIGFIWPKNSHQSCSNIERIILDFVNTDQLSDGFRYPLNKKGEKNLNGICIINLRAFHDAITPIIEELEGISLSISIYKSEKNETMNDYRINSDQRHFNTSQIEI